MKQKTSISSEECPGSPNDVEPLSEEISSEYLEFDEEQYRILTSLLSESNSSQNLSGVQGLKHQVLSKSARFVLCSQVWLHALPTHRCDVLITAPASDPRSASVITWVINQIKLREPRLKLEARYHANMDQYGLYITARYDNLLKGAETLQVRKRLKEMYGGGLRDFVYEDAGCFENVECQSSFLSSQERSLIVLHYLRGLRAVGEDELFGVPFREGQAIIPALMSKAMLSQVLPLHKSEDLKVLESSWVKNLSLTEQPLDKICDYFGEKIGMYFAWLGFYTTALCIPAFLGVFHWLFLKGTDQLTDDICLVSCALINILWSTVYLESWKRRQAELAYKWGTLGMADDLLVEPRPQFRGEFVRSSVTGRLEMYYPAWRRRLVRYCVSYPITGICIALVFAIMLLVFELQEWTNKQFAGGGWFSSLFTFLPKIILAVVIGVCDELYGRVALMLNNLENCRTEINFENHLITKTILFQFINSFLSLFYIGFYLKDLDRLSEQLAALLITRQVIGNVKEAVLPLVLGHLKLGKMTYKMTKSMSNDTLLRHVEDIRKTKSAVGLPATAEASAANSPMTETAGAAWDVTPACETVVLPSNQQGAVAELCAPPLNRRQSSTNSRVYLPVPEFKVSGPRLTQAEVESLLPKYTSPLEDYMEMYIQFGYVLLFSPAFPLAALCAFVNNVFEIRVDAFKLCTSFQRPFAQRVENIGSWQAAMEVMCIIGVIVNCALIGQSGLVQRFWPDMSLGGQILFIVILEHIVLAMKFLVSFAIPDVPHWVTVEMAKTEFKRREALRKLESQITTRSKTQQGLPLKSCSIPDIASSSRERDEDDESDVEADGRREKADDNEPHEMATLLRQHSILRKRPAVKSSGQL